MHTQREGSGRRSGSAETKRPRVGYTVDSMGVGQYILMRLFRGKALRALATGPPHPSVPSEPVPEVVFSDDSRLFAHSSDELRANLNLAFTIANCAGAQVNRQKFRIFTLTSSPKGLLYSSHPFSCLLGDFNCQKKRPRLRWHSVCDGG